MVLHSLQPSLNGGEIAPSLHHRVDLQKFSTCVKKAKNMFVHPQGGMSNRAGTLMLAKSKDEKVRIIPFEFSNNQTYMIEFGNEYCRFYTTDGLIVTEDGEPYEIISPFKTEDLDKIRYCQSADVMYIAWGGKPKTLTRLGHTDWAFANYDYKNGPYEASVEEIKGHITKEESENITVYFLETLAYEFKETDVNRFFKLNANIKSNNYGGRISSLAIAEDLEKKIFFVPADFTVQTSGTWSGVFYLQVSDDLEVWENKVSFSSYNNSSNYDYAGDFSGKGKFVKFSLSGLGTYSDSGLNLNFRSTSSSYNISLIVSAVVDKNKAEISVSDENSYILECINSVENASLSDYSFPILTSNTSSEDVSFSGTLSTVSEAWKMFDGDPTTALNMPKNGVGNIEIFFNVPGGLFLSSVNLDMVSRYYTGETDSGNALKVGISTLKGGVWTWREWVLDHNKAERKVYVKSLPAAYYDGVRIEIVSNNYSKYGGYIYGVTFNDLKYAPTKPLDFSLEIGSWRDLNNYPTEVDIYQDRIVWVTNNTVDATKISDYKNFGVSTEVTDDDAVSVIIKDKKINKINSIITGSQLVVFTDSGNFIHNNETFTPSTATFLNQGATGGADVKPVIVRDNIIYVHPMKQAISDYAYSFETDGYAGQDITILSNHLFENKKIKELAYQQEPYSIIWILQEEGTVLACTYLRQQNVTAWTPMDFGGKVLSIGVMSNGSNQELYLAVERANGTYVEKMQTRMISNNPKEQFFVDCGRTYRGTAANVISGLDYLEGQEVAILADGEVQQRQVVKNGEITLKYPASVVHVGLPYESEVKSLSMDFNGGDGTYQDRKKRIVGVTVFFMNTVGGEIGTEGFELDPLSRVKPVEFNSPEPLRDFSQHINLAGIHEYSPSIVIKQSEPLPITVTGWVTKIAPGG